MAIKTQEDYNVGKYKSEAFLVQGRMMMYLKIGQTLHEYKYDYKEVS